MRVPDKQPLLIWRVPIPNARALSPLKMNNPREWMCSLCATNLAISFCCCGTSETLLCSTCCASHFTKLPARVHTSLPIICYGNHKKLGFMERLQVRNSKLPERAEILRENLIKVDECIAKFEENVEKMIAKIREEAKEIVQEIMVCRGNLVRDIDIAIEEAENTICSEETPSISALGKLLRDPSIGVHQLTQFAYQLENPFKIPLRNYITYRFYDPNIVISNPTILFSISGKALTIYGLPEGEIKENRILSQSFSSGTIFCKLDDTLVMCLGTDKHVFMLNIGDGNTITAAPEMNTARGWPGVILINSWVYVFGGWDVRRIRESEKYSIAGRKWQCLPPMSIPKYAFNPCICGTDIYLIELRDYKGAEKFNTVSENYTTLSVMLPTTITFSAYNVLKGREMVFLSVDKKVHKWNIDTNAYSVSNFTGNLPELPLVSNCPPLCVGNKAYFAQEETGKIAIYDFVTSHLAYQSIRKAR